MRRARPTKTPAMKKDARSGTWDKYNLRQGVTQESLFILIIFCNPTDNFDVGVGR